MRGWISGSTTERTEPARTDLPRRRSDARPVERELNKKRRLLLFKALVWLVGLAPLVWLIWRGFTDRLGANPIEEVLHHLGDTALIYLLVTLSITPVRRLTGWNSLAPLRRADRTVRVFLPDDALPLVCHHRSDTRLRVHRRGRGRAPVYSGGLHCLVAADSPGDHFDQRMDPETQEELATGSTDWCTCRPVWACCISTGR